MGINYRQATNKIFELIDEGMLDQETVLLAALNWMSEDDVKELAEREGYFAEEDGDNG